MSTRRTILSALATAPLAALPEIAPALDAPATNVDPLWAEWVDMDDRIAEAENCFFAARERLPFWAKPGPKYLRSDGSFDGEITDWALDVSAKPPEFRGAMKNVRMSLFDCRELLRLQTSWDGKERAGKAYARRLRRLAQLRQAQRAEFRKVNLQELEEKYSNLQYRQYDLANLIVECRDTSINAIAAKVVAAIWLIDTPDRVVGMRLDQFKHPLESLVANATGRIARDVKRLFVREPNGVIS